MGLRVNEIIDVVVSHAMATAWFERVNTHEPKNAPPYGLNCAVWVEHIEPIRASGLGSASVRLELSVRAYSNMLQEPQDAIDPNLALAVQALFEAYIGDFELGNEARMIDVFGAHGNPLSSQSGYIRQDNKLYRVMTITLPIIVNDVWEEAP